MTRVFYATYVELKTYLYEVPGGDIRVAFFRGMKISVYGHGYQVVSSEHKSPQNILVVWVDPRKENKQHAETVTARNGWWHKFDGHNIPSYMPPPTGGHVQMEGG